MTDYLDDTMAKVLTVTVPNGSYRRTWTELCLPPVVAWSGKLWFRSIYIAGIVGEALTSRFVLRCRSDVEGTTWVRVKGSEEVHLSIEAVAKLLLAKAEDSTPEQAWAALAAITGGDEDLAEVFSGWFRDGLLYEMPEPDTLELILELTARTVALHHLLYDTDGMLFEMLSGAVPLKPAKRKRAAKALKAA